MALRVDSQLGTGVPNIRSSDYGFGDYYRQGAAVYGDVLKGFNSVLQAQEARNQAIQARYDSLTSGVLGDLNNAEAGQMGRIQDQYAASLGDISQSGVDRGLSNFTIQDNLKRGAAEDKMKQQLDASGLYAGQRASYRAQLGSQANAFAAQSGQAADALGQAALGFEGSYKSFLPDPLGYAQLSQQQSQFEASQQQERQLAQPEYLGSSYAHSGGTDPTNSYAATYFSPRSGSTFRTLGTY